MGIILKLLKQLVASRPSANMESGDIETVYNELAVIFINNKKLFLQNKIRLWKHVPLYNSVTLHFN